MLRLGGGVQDMGSVVGWFSMSMSSCLIFLVLQFHGIGADSMPDEDFVGWPGLDGGPQPPGSFHGSGRPIAVKIIFCWWA
jgi:hypothetical protein